MGLKKLAKKVGNLPKKTAKSVKKAAKNPGRIPKKVIGETGRVIEGGADLIGDVIEVTVDGIGAVFEGAVNVIDEAGDEFADFLCDLVGKEPGVDCHVSAGADVGTDGNVVLTDGSGNGSTLPNETSDFLDDIAGVWAWSREQEEQKFSRSQAWVFQNCLDAMLVTSPFGNRDDGFHAAVDLRARTPKEVYASGPGYIIHAGPVAPYPNSGITVTVRHPQSIEVQYMHLSEANVKVGDLVFGGSSIAKTGDTGSAAGKPHLHVVVKIGGTRVDPMVLFGKKIKLGTTVVQ